jgi:putative MATE family efflux protein
MAFRNNIVKLTIPIFLEQIFIISMGVLNTIMAGHIGKEAVSAIGMVDSINFIFIAFLSSLAIGGTVVVAHYIGQCKIPDANEAAKQALFSGFLLAFIVTLFIWIFQKSVVNLLYGAAEPIVKDYAKIYLNITLLTYPLISITSIACGIFRGAGDTKTPMKINILMSLFNILLSYVFIYGLNLNFLPFNMPGMGVKGASIGIALARAIGAVAIMGVLLKGSKTIKLSNPLKFRFNLEIQKSLFNIGVPSAIESLMFNGGKLITQIFIVGMGTVSLAANYISGSICGVINIPGTALCIVAPTLVAQSMGRGDSDEAKNLMVYVTKLSSICMVILCAVTFPAASLISSAYTQNTEVIALASSLLRVSCIITPLFWSLSFVLPNALNGTGDTRYTMTTTIIGMWAFRIVLGYVLGISLKLGVEGVWIGMFVDWMVRGILYCLRVKNGKWKWNVIVKNTTEFADCKCE